MATRPKSNRKWHLRSPWGMYWNRENGWVTWDGRTIFSEQEKNEMGQHPGETGYMQWQVERE